MITAVTPPANLLCDGMLIGPGAEVSDQLCGLGSSIQTSSKLADLLERLASEHFLSLMHRDYQFLGRLACA